MPTYTIQISSHAAERFNERVRPALTADAAADEFARIALVGTVSEAPPPWHLRNCAQITPFYLEVADILVPLKPHWSEPGVLVATTCIPKGSLSDASRERRTARRRRDRQPAGQQRRGGRPVGIVAW